MDTNEDDIINVDPKVDIVFKKVFGSIEHTNITLNFVNSILTAAGLAPAVQLEIENPNRLAEFKNDKDIEIDLLYIDADGKQIQLEMQMLNHAGLPKRMLHNWAQLYFQQIKKGENYTELKEVVSIWILNSRLYPDTDYLHVFRLKCDRTKRIMNPDCCIITIELPLWKALKSRRKIGILSSNDKWLYFLTSAYQENRKKVLDTLIEPEYAEALEIMAGITLTQKLRHYYNMRANYQHIVASYKKTGYDEGREEGLAEGLAEGLLEGKLKGKLEGKLEGEYQKALEIAKKMKLFEMKIEDISLATGLSIKEIETL